MSSNVVFSQLHVLATRLQIPHATKNLSLYIVTWFVD